MAKLTGRDRTIARRLSDEFRTIPDGDVVDRVLQLLDVHWPELSPTQRVSLARELLPILKSLDGRDGRDHGRDAPSVPGGGPDEPGRAILENQGGPYDDAHHDPPRGDRTASRHAPR